LVQESPVPNDVQIDRHLWDELLARAQGLEKLHVRVGVLSSKGGDSMDGEFRLVDLAALMEFGSDPDGPSPDHIPARAPIRTTFYQRCKQELVDMQTKLAKQIVTGGMDPKRAMGILGSWGANAIKKTITEGEGLPPPNAPSTIAAKGSSRPLVDTGAMKASYSYEVSEDEGDGL
jgi:hypothetical protein